MPLIPEGHDHLFNGDELGSEIGAVDTVSNVLRE